MTSAQKLQQKLILQVIESESSGIGYLELMSEASIKGKTKFKNRVSASFPDALSESINDFLNWGMIESSNNGYVITTSGKKYSHAL